MCMCLYMLRFSRDICATLQLCLSFQGSKWRLRGDDYFSLQSHFHIAGNFQGWPPVGQSPYWWAWAVSLCGKVWPEIGASWVLRPTCLYLFSHYPGLAHNQRGLGLLATTTTQNQAAWMEMDWPLKHKLRCQLTGKGASRGWNHLPKCHLHLPGCHLQQPTIPWSCVHSRENSRPGNQRVKVGISSDYNNSKWSTLKAFVFSTHIV